MRVLRRTALGVAAAVAAGVVLGVTARLMMRLATLATGREAEFSLGGTVGILLIFVLAALPGAVVASLVRGRGRSVLLVICAVLLCVPATGVAGTDLGELEGLSGVQWTGVVMATVGVYAAILALRFLTLRLIALGRRESISGAVSVIQPGVGD